MTLDKAKEARIRIKVIAVSATFIQVRKKVIDALAVYGKEAIPDILEVVQAENPAAQDYSDEIKTYGLAKVEELKKT